jgi:glycosyltransferase involved in cell wall biosynthesis
VAEELVEKSVGVKEQYVNIAPGVKELSITPRTDALKNLGINDDGRPIIGWIARVTGVKNPMRALEVARAIPTAHFVMAGGGDLLEEVKGAAPSNVTVLGWAKAEDLFGVSEIILSTSENEGMPIALIEAQLAGKPVVATDVGGVAEVIANHETGLVTNKNAGSIAAAVNSLILDTQKRAQMSTLATSRARALFSIDQMVNAHVSLYNSIVN